MIEGVVEGVPQRTIGPYATHVDHPSQTSSNSFVPSNDRPTPATIATRIPTGTSTDADGPGSCGDRRDLPIHRVRVCPPRRDPIPAVRPADRRIAARTRSAIDAGLNASPRQRARVDLRLIARPGSMSGMATKTDQRLRLRGRNAAEIVDAIRASGADEVAISIGNERYRLDPEIAELITTVLDDVSYGHEVTSAPANLPIGTEVASELLGVSRPWLTTLLDRGEIPSTRVGTKRRMRLGDVLAFRRADDARRDRLLTWDFLDED